MTWDAFNDMPWFWILMLVDEHIEYIKKQEKGQDESNDIIAQQQANMDKMNHQQQQMMNNFQQPQMPQMPDFKF